MTHKIKGQDVLQRQHLVVCCEGSFTPISNQAAPLSHVLDRATFHTTRTQTQFEILSENPYTGCPKKYNYRTKS